MHPAHDALSARIAEQAGAKAVTVGGFAASGVLLGQPDSSQLTATELEKFYEGICASVDIPVFVDADTGFGGVTNVIRTVKDFERAGGCRVVYRGLGVSQTLWAHGRQGCHLD